MKIMKSFLIISIISISVFQISCKKEKVDLPPEVFGSIVFWTKNAAKLSACSGNLQIDVYLIGLTSTTKIGVITLTTVDASAPIVCVLHSVNNISLPATTYYEVSNCATGGVLERVFFNLAVNECRKIEIV